MEGRTALCAEGYHPPWWEGGIYAEGYHPPWYQGGYAGGYYPPWYQGGYAGGIPPCVPGRLCRRDTHPMYTTLCTPGIHHLVYTPLYHPGYTTIMSCTPSTSAPATSLPGRRALGSKREKGLGRRLSFLLKS